MKFLRNLLSALALFIFIFLYETVLHSYLLLGMYEATANVWRDFAEMEARMPLALVYQLALSAWSTFAFSQLYKEGGMRNGLLFGIFFGVFAGILTSSWYLWLNVPVQFALSWFVIGVGEGVGGGFVLGLMSYPKQIKNQRRKKNV